MIRLSVVMALALAGRLLAQSEPEIPPPSAPLVLPLPAMMRVTLVLKEDKPASQDGESPGPPASANSIVTWKSVEVIKTGDIRLITATMTDGQSRDTWVLGGKLFNTTSDGKQVSCGDYQPMFPSFFQTGNTAFYGTDWIALKNYRGIVPFGGKKCYYYEDEETRADLALDKGVVPNPKVPSSKSLRKAWIDVESRLPVAVTLPEGLARYRFAKAPDSGLMPPQEFTEYFLRLKKEADRRQKEAAVR
jgi:hypothetical protein